MTLCVAVTSLLVPIGAQAAVTVGQPVYTLGGDSVPIPQPGELTTTVDVSGTGEASLILALYQKEDGRLLDIVMSETKTLSGASDTLSATMLIDELSTKELRVFVWDKNNMIPFDVPDDDALYLEMGNIDNRVLLFWYSCDGILTGDFNILRDGEVIATATDKGGYIHEVAADAYDHTYQIKTADGTRVSNTVTLPANENVLTFEEAAAQAWYSMDNGMWKASGGWGIEGGFATNGWTYTCLASGAPANTVEDITVYIRANAPAAFGYCYKQYDSASGTARQVKMNYALTGSSYGSYAMYKFTGTDVMLDRSISGILDNENNTGAFMSLCACGGGTMNVTGVYVFKTSDVTEELDTAMMQNQTLRNADELYPDGVEITFANSAQVSDGISYISGGGDGAVTISGSYIDIGKHVGGSGSWRKKPRFVVEDEYIYGKQDRYLQLEIEYETNLGALTGEDNAYMRIMYKNQNGKERNEYIPVIPDGERHTAYFQIDNAGFDNTYDTGVDFALTSMSGDMDNEYLHVYRVKVTNLSHRPLGNYVYE